MKLSNIHNELQKELAAVNLYIQENIPATIPLINQINDYIFKNPGKYIRASIILLLAKSVGNLNEKHISLASIIEIIHIATLLHDDVVDDSNMRRGKAAARIKYGNKRSVLVGDYLYTKAFQIMSELDSLALYKLIANTTNQIAEGEVLQLTQLDDLKITESAYMHLVAAKTSVLFAAATKSAAIISNLSSAQQDNLYLYGMHFGNAFQLMNDLLDYKMLANTASNLGKDLGDDLAEKKITLPLIYTLQEANQTDTATIIKILKLPNPREKLTEVLALLQKYQALEYTFAKAKAEINLANNYLVEAIEGKYKDILLKISELVLRG